MLPLLKPYLHQKGDPSAEDCRAALEVVRGELDATRGRIAEFRTHRANAIVDGVSYDRLDKIDGDLRHAGIDRQRLKIARDLLRGMITEAEVKARSAECDALLRAAVQHKSAGLDLIGEYTALAGRLVRVLEELAEAEAAIAEANQRLTALGDARHVQSIEASYWTGREPGIATYPPWSLISQTRVCDVEIARKLAWPRGDLS